MTPYSRRGFLKQSGLGLLTFCVGGCEVELTPGQARAQGAALRVLTKAEVACLEAFGETLLPGSPEAGIANYVDHQLAQPSGSQLLMLKYLGADPPFEPIYRTGLAALDRAAQTAARRHFAELGTADRRDLVSQVVRKNPPGWDDGPPAPFFGFVVRSDALDVTYGTVAGFAALGIPYMAHIMPPSRWGE